jgi:hypothetical protein
VFVGGIVAGGSIVIISGVGVKVKVGGIGVLLGTGVSVGRTTVSVGNKGVEVGGTGVEVGPGTTTVDVRLGGICVWVLDGNGVWVGRGVAVRLGKIGLTLGTCNF